MNRPMLASAVVALLASQCSVAASAPATEAVRAEAREIYSTIIGYETVEGRGQVPVMAE